MNDELPGFGIDFEINAGDSYGQLAQLDALMKSVEGKILQQAFSIEKATRGMIDVSESSANVRSLATTTAGAMKEVERSIGQAVSAKTALDQILAKTAVTSSAPAASGAEAKRTAEINATEKAINKLVLQMERETAAIGQTAEQRRAARIEELALTAVQQKNTEGADRLLTVTRALGAARQAAAEDAAEAAARDAAASEAQAQAYREAAFAYQQFEARARQGAVALRDQEAAAERDAGAVARLREMLDPAAAAQDRLNRELVEARRAMKAAGASAEEVARAEQLLTARTLETGRSTGAAKASMQNLGFQLQDFSVQVVGGTSVLRAFAMQFPQAAGALTGFEGKLGRLGGFLAGPWGIALTLGITLLAGFADKLFETGDAANKAADGLKKFQDRQSDIGNFIDSTTGKLIEQNRTLVLNAALTRQAAIAENNKEISEQRKAAFRAAGNQQTRTPTFTAGSTAAPIRMRETDPDVQRAIQAAAGDVDKLATSLAKLASTSRPDLKPLALQISSTAGAAIIATRENEKLGKEIRALSGDTNALAGNTTALIGKQVALATATTPLARARAQLAIVEQGAAAADKAGGAALVKYRTDLTAATNAVNAADAAQRNALAAKRDATKESNKAAAAARKEANHAAELARDAAAIEAQIRNLGTLSKAYAESGEAALIAEARLKAESKAITQRGDIEAAVAREVRLMTAQRINDAAKGAGAMRDQARVQAAVNAEVAAGNVPAARAAELVRDRMADLPLLAALQAAERAKDQAGIEAVTAALEELRQARLGVTEAEAGGRLAATMQAGRDILAQLDEELRLVGATNAEREIGLATLRATQDAAAQGITGQDGVDHIAQQIAIAKGQQAVAEKQAAFNAELGATSELFDTIDQSAQRSAQGMADAFGQVGATIGDVLTIMTGYYADQARLQQAHDAAIREAGKDQVRIDRENRLFAMRTSSMQIGAFGNMASAAKGFFKEGSTGYQALATAEKTFRTIQFALSIRAIAQDAIETGSKIANSVARTAAGATEAV